MTTNKMSNSTTTTTTTTKTSTGDSDPEPPNKPASTHNGLSTATNNHHNNNNNNNKSSNNNNNSKVFCDSMSSLDDQVPLDSVIMVDSVTSFAMPRFEEDVDVEFCDLMRSCDCGKYNDDDKDSLVGMSASEDDEDTELERLERSVNRQLALREIDNTSDLTSSPPPLHSSTHSNCSSPIDAIHGQSPSPTDSPSSSRHNSLLSLDTINCRAECSGSGGAVRCLSTCPVHQEDRLLSQPSALSTSNASIERFGLCSSNTKECHFEPKGQHQQAHQQQQRHEEPHQRHQFLYPPTVSSIRDAVSHLTRLDDFNVVKLSHGFFSQVFKVIHFGTKRVLVLKMNKDTANKGNALREIELLNKLNHENIVAYMGTVVHEGALHPLLEYINGGTLEQLIKQFYNNENNLPASQSSHCTPRLNVLSPKVHRLEDPDWTFVKLMGDVSCGMAYLHSMGYLHRDLASKNIFIRKLPLSCTHSESNDKHSSCDRCEHCLALEEFDDRRLVAVIGDFGFATHEPEPDQMLSTVGSPYWLAPECLKNFWYNHKCDVYSFGVVCCELNWRIPADPDFLPRSNDFSVDFGKLTTKKDSVLGQIAQLACQNDPCQRPEFHALQAMLEQRMEDKRVEQSIDDLANRVKSSSFETTTASSRANDKVKGADRNNNRLLNYSNAPQLQQPLGQDNRRSSNSNSDASIMFNLNAETLPTTDSGNINHQTRDVDQESLKIDQHCFDQNDIFDQHLLRRRFSSWLSPAPNKLTQISPRFGVDLYPYLRHPYMHMHQQQFQSQPQ